MAETRNDGYINAVLGHGLRRRDPFANYGYANTFNQLTDYRQADAMFSGNGLLKRVIQLPATDALRKGYKVDCADEIPNYTRHKVRSVLEDIDADKKLELALTWDRLYGGAVVLILADDGGTLEDPLNVNRLRRIAGLEVYAPEAVSFTDAMLYASPTDPNYGHPQFYNIIGLWGNSFLVHESRLLMFYGADISNYYRRMRNGWGGTVYEQVKSELLHYTGGNELAFMALSRLSQGILKLDNLMDVLMQEGGEEIVQKRLQIIDMARHMMNTIAIDTADDYDLKNLSLSGIKDVLEQFQLAICSATGIPATILFGRSPAGMNATGKSDLETYYNLVEGIQRHTLKKPLSRLIDLIGECSDYGVTLPREWSIDFKPLWNESDKEKAETCKLKAEGAKTKADGLNTLVQGQIITADEARAILSNDDDYQGVFDEDIDNILRTPRG